MIAASKGEWASGVVHWRDGDVAYLSVVFTWDLPKARELADYYRRFYGCSVRAGGPGVFTRRDYLADVAVVGGEAPGEVMIRHNPMATIASRGCSVGCWFCIVPKMEGRTFTELPDFVPRPVLCDNNLSALRPEYQQHIVDRYTAVGVPLLDANSGFEPATFDEEVYRRWEPINKGPWRFGYDENTEGESVARVFKMLRDLPPKRKQVYTMIGHEPFDVCMDRIRKVIALGGEPYAQPFIKLNALTKRPAIRHDWTPQKLRWVQRWVNRHIWRKVPDFADYRPSVKTAVSSRDGDSSLFAA